MGAAQPCSAVDTANIFVGCVVRDVPVRLLVLLLSASLAWRRLYGGTI